MEGRSRGGGSRDLALLRASARGAQGRRAGCGGGRAATQAREGGERGSIGEGEFFFVLCAYAGDGRVFVCSPNLLNVPIVRVSCYLRRLDPK